MKKNIYITTTLPYINSTPHIGFATELIRADVLARFYSDQGFDVYFNTGTDEHGKKIQESAEQQGLTVGEFTNKMSQYFRDLITNLDIVKNINFIRTTDNKHIDSAKKLWALVRDNGYIYKKKYSSKYCVGCELEKTDSELVNGVCPIHPNRKIELLEEENYFFAFSKLQDDLLKYYENNKNFITPDFRFNELKSFVNSGLQDFSISRLKIKMPWGISVPNDNDHVMYVWFDALTNYISTLDWPDGINYEKYWENAKKIQVCGQDNLRQQGAMWQAMLLAAKLPLTDCIYINGFLIGEDGQKMSKSLGNTINPSDLVTKYGADSVRYILLRHTNPFSGSPIGEKNISEYYNAHLVNGLGNLISRIMAMSEKIKRTVDLKEIISCDEKYIQSIREYRFDNACDYIWNMVSSLDKKIANEKPYQIINSEKEKAIVLLDNYINDLNKISYHLKYIMPRTSKIIAEHIKDNIKPTKPLFPRL